MVEGRLRDGGSVGLGMVEGRLTDGGSVGLGGGRS